MMKSNSENFIPNKTASTTNHLPWVNQTIKRLIRNEIKPSSPRKGQTTHQKVLAFLNSKVKASIRRAHREYVEGILNINTHNFKTSMRPNTKLIYSLIKNSKTESSSIPLNSEIQQFNKLHYDEADKATVKPALPIDFQFKVPSPICPIILKYEASRHWPWRQCW